MMQKTAILLSAALSLGFSSRSTDAAFGGTSFPVAKQGRPTATSLSMSIIDDLQLIFSEEGKKNRAEFQARERAEAEEALRQVQERRRDPEKMREYEEQRAAERKAVQEEKNLWSFQQKTEKDYDPLTDWKKLRAEGKIKVGSDLARDESSRRLGSEGLVDVRTDELLPYIDQGYVDEDADVMGKFMKMFGGGKKN